MAVRSELQVSILRFVREVWKFVNTVPEPAQSHLRSYVRTELNTHKNIPRIKFHQIEYRLRKGRNMFAMIK